MDSGSVLIVQRQEGPPIPLSNLLHKGGIVGQAGSAHAGQDYTRRLRSVAGPDSYYAREGKKRRDPPLLSIQD